MQKPLSHIFDSVMESPTFRCFLIKMLANSSFFRIMNRFADIRFTVDRIGDFVDVTHNMSSSDRFGDLA